MKTIKVTALVFAILLAGFLTVSLTVDGIVKSQLEGTLTSMMETEVEIGDVDISILGGESGIKELSIANPEGFSEQNAIYLEEIYMKLNVRSLLSDQIIIEELRVSAPKLLVEQKGIGVNLRELNSAMSDGSDASGEGKSLIIEYLLVVNGEVKLLTEIDEERTVTAQLDEFELNGIGKENSGTVEQSIREIMEPIIDEALSEALKDGVLEQLENKARELLNR